jgi:hypothetical protein
MIASADALKHATTILDGFSHNDWDGSIDPETLAGCRFAVVVERDDDSWVHGADSVADVAKIAIACREATEGYDEWISEVVDVATGEHVAYQEVVTVRVSIGGETATADSLGGMG